MAYQRVKQPKISDVIMEQLEAMILEGSLKPGQKLPPERELAVQFEVSRPSLREALQKLAARGLIHSRQGGGSYVAENVGNSFVDPLTQLFASHPEAQYDLLEFRHALEGVTAYYAALRCTDADRVRLQTCHDNLQAAHDAKQFAKETKADADFHLAIAEASHNAVLLHTMRALFTLLRKNIYNNLESIYPKRDIRALIHDQHSVLLQSILDGDPEAARKAAHDHLAFVEDAIIEQSKESTRSQRAIRRSSI
ncbi:MAG: pyruvate dehydrogenase complex transcriptional repressor PdhR [Gammaproteobacteria bacterium]|nr:pyruvate dehydrogenase complex transcriptional repressor PdhR [Gammaproteobacteria bacterium]